MQNFYFDWMNFLWYTDYLFLNTPLQFTSEKNQCLRRFSRFQFRRFVYRHENGSFRLLIVTKLEFSDPFS